MEGSPEQIYMIRNSEIGVSPSTIRRWISLGYAGISNLDLRRQIRYKPRRNHKEQKPTKHGYDRSCAAFLELSEEDRLCCCEMDTVLGFKDERILTLYCRPIKLISLLVAIRHSAS